MSDMPIQTVLQQREARPVSGEHLEVLGKKASADWHSGRFNSLNDAVVGTVRSELLSPEQVRRVVEFCNQDAYLTDFRKEGAHRVVHFDRGPADPAQVLQDLNDGGGGSLYDNGMLDYRLPPEAISKAAAARAANSMDKTASVEEPGAAALPKLTKMPGLPKAASERFEGHLWALFGAGKEAHVPYAEPLRPLLDVRMKLSDARDHIASEVDSLELAYADAGNDLYQTVKTATFDGASLGDIVTAWSTVNEDQLYVKLAFHMLTPRLRRDGLFDSYDAIGASLQKVAGAATRVNPSHPLVAAYDNFCETLDKLASLRALKEELGSGAEQAHDLLKKADAGGLVGHVVRGARAAGGAIDRASPGIAKALVGQEGSSSLAPTLATGLKATGIIGGALAGNAALQSVTDRPMVRNTLEAAKSVVPGTAEYQMRRYRNMTGQ